MSSTDPGGNQGPAFKQELRERLVAQAGQEIKKRKTRRRAGVVGAWVAVAAVGVTSFLTLNPDPAVAGVITVTRDGEFQVIQLTQLDASPTEVRKELREAGIKGEIEALPAAPSAIGEFLTASVDRSAINPIDETNGTFTGFKIQAGSSFTIGFGRPAQPGEQYSVAVDAYLEGNLLHCSKLWGAPAAEAMAYAQAKNIKLRFQAPGNPALVTDPDSPAGVVTDAFQSASDEAVVYVADTPVSPLVASESTGPRDCK